MTFPRHPQILSTSIVFCLCVVVSHSAMAVVEAVNVGSDGAWTTNTNWADGSAPTTGGTLTNTRLNVNGMVDYNFPGVTTIFDASPSGGEARPLGIGSGSNTNGVLNVTAGTLTFTTETGGLLADKAAFITAAADASNNATGLLHIAGGNVVINGGSSALSIMTRGGASSSGTLTIDSGSLSVDRIDFGNISVVAGATGTVNLNGGVLNVRSISSGNSVMTVNVNLNGGTIATSGAAVVGQDLIGANIDNAVLGGAVAFDTSLGNGTISALLGGTGSITKTGAGTLSITGAASYTGPTTVNAGTFATTTSQTGTGKVDVSDNATFALRLASAGATFSTGSLTLGTTAGATLRIDAGSAGFSAANPLISTTSFSTGSATSLQINGGAITSGVFPLIDYTGNIGGSGFGGLSVSLIGLPRAIGTLVNNTEATRVDLNVTNQGVKWVGNVSANWDIDDSGTGTTEGTQNWRTETALVATNYLQGSGGTDTVIFDDSATGSRAVNLTTSLTPSAIVVNNSVASGAYSFVGSGSIDGAAILTKNGTGTLTIANTTANTFSGTTTINAGKVQIGDGTTFGAGSLGTGGIVMAGGTLEINRPDGLTLANAITGTAGTIALTSGDLTLAGTGTNYSGGINLPAGRILSLTNTLALGAAISGAGDLSINPLGNKIVTLSGSSNFTGAINVTNLSHLRISTNTALGSTAGGTVVTGSGSGLDNDANGSSLQLSGDITVTDEPLSILGTGGSATGLTAQRGALQSVSGNNTWAGPVTIAGAGTRIGVQDGASLTISGTISDGGIGSTVIFRGGTTTPGMITLSGTGNSWGQTNVYGSTTRIAGGDDILPVGAALFVGTNGVGNSIFDLNGHNQRVAGLSQVAGTATTNIITNNGNADSVLTIDAFIDRSFFGTLTDGPTNKLSLVKDGAFTQTLSSVSTYTGTTTIKGGTLLVNGSIAGSATTVDGGTLAGNGGTLGSVTVSATGILSPGTLTGSLIGSLNTGTLTLNGDSTFALDLDVTSQLADFVGITGDLVLSLTGSPLLSLNNVGFDTPLAPGTPITFLTYSGAWNGGLFQVNGVPIRDGVDMFQLGENLYTIDYNYLGNNVALIAVPEPTSATLALGGVVGMLSLGRRRRRRM